METKDADLSSLRIDRSKRGAGGRNAGKNRKIYVFMIPVAVIAAGAVAALIATSDSSVSVKAATAMLQSPARSEAVLEASGYVVAERKAAVASKATGRLVYLGVSEGDKVTRGEVIARLEDSDVKAQLAEAKANLELNEANLSDASWNYNRDKTLLKSGSITESAFESARAGYLKGKASVDIAKANVQAAEVALDNTYVRAPFDGTVISKNADVGEIVAPMAGSINARGTVVTIADMSSLEVEPDVAESNIEKVTPGQPCIITLDAYPGVQYQGYVSKIIPTANRSKGTVTVKVKFKKYDSRVLPEMSAKVMFLQDGKRLSGSSARPVLTIPESAVVTRGDKQIVFRIKHGRVMETEVSIGRHIGRYVEVRSGLSDGEEVVDSPTGQVKNGVKVMVQK